jgi:TorA maturation chaperone TorD
LAFLYPTEERLGAIVETADEMLEEGAVLAQFAFFIQWTQLLHALNAFGRQEPPRIAQIHLSLFAANPAGVPCPPYESVYREPTGSATGWLLAQVESAYKTAGLVLAPDVAELPDHVAVEFGFLAYLCGREADAWEAREVEPGVQAVRRQKRFLDRHLAAWFPDFAAQVAVVDSGAAYADLSGRALAFIKYDSDLLAALLEAPPVVVGAP